MPFEIACHSCGQSMRVSEEHIGRRARCPKCQTQFTVTAPGGETTPAGPAATPVSPPPPFGPPTSPVDPSSSAGTAPSPYGVEKWWVKTPDGQSYGPTSRADLDQWVQAGRVHAQCQLLREGDASWQWAGSLFPGLGYGAAPGAAFGAGGTMLAPHHGGAILTFSLLGLFCCPMSIAAAIWGYNDLQQIRSGRMDPAGEGLTKAGMYIGMVLLGLQALYLVFVVVVGVLGNIR